MLLKHFIPGIHTGSVYHDGALRKRFNGEGRRDTSVIGIKTHGSKSVANRVEYRIQRIQLCAKVAQHNSRDIRLPHIFLDTLSCWV